MMLPHTAILYCLELEYFINRYAFYVTLSSYEYFSTGEKKRGGRRDMAAATKIAVDNRLKFPDATMKIITDTSLS